MRKVVFQSFFALLLVAAGVLLLLNNLGFIDAEAFTIWNLFYPAVFIIWGLKKVVESLARMRRRRRFNLEWFWGIGLGILGTLLLLGYYDVLDFQIGMIWRLWPLLIVYIGLSIIFDDDDGGWGSWDSDEQDFWTFKSDDPDSDKDKQKFYKKGVSVGNMKRTRENWSAQSMNLTSSIGEYDFDYTQAFIPEENILVKMSGWVGDVKILIPRDVEFSVAVRGGIGDVYVAGQKREGFNPELAYKTPGYDEAERKLTFNISYKIVDLRIDHV